MPTLASRTPAPHSKDPRVEPEAADPFTDPAAQPVDILLVDDQPRNLLALTAILDHPQYRCVQATSGAEALRLILERSFALILLDVVMPGMDGLEVASLVKARPRSRSVPIIFLTAEGEDLPRIHQAYSLGAVDYLVKPVRPDVVRAKVRVFVDLFRTTETVKRQAELLRAHDRREREHELAELLRAAETARADAERALEARDEFLRIASHELRTPLASLSLQIQWLARNARGEVRQPLSEAVIRRQLENAEQQVGRLSALITAVFDVSRIASAQTPLDLAEADLAKIVRDVGARFMGPCLDEGCVLEVVTDEPIMGRCDAARVEQMIGNLVANAMRYGAGRPITLRIARDEESAVVSVEDRGVGIAPEHHARIFERFDRASASISCGGLGLGLYVARTLAVAHGGSITVESDVGKGATFRLTLPLSGPAQPQNS